MDRVYNQDVAKLIKVLIQYMDENGYSASMKRDYVSFAKQLSNFMSQNGLQEYNESIGAAYLDDFCQNHEVSTAVKARLFVARMDGIHNSKGLVSHIKMVPPVILPEGLESLLDHYKRYCLEKGLHPGSIWTYDRHCREFLRLLAEESVSNGSGFTTSAVSAACLKLPSKSYFSPVRTFLRYLYDEGELERDYSAIIPRYKKPQPMPSVYSVDEIRKIEMAIDRDSPSGKRNYAVVLLATRLGIRSGNIAMLSMDELDFQSETIRIIQQKTRVPLELPMLPAIRDALIDYIQNARRGSDSKYVFLSMYPPYSHLTATGIGDCIRDAIKAAGIESGNRKQGPHAMRASMASSMVNDNIPYEVVRRTLGHTGKNAIKSYAKLDVKQLEAYTLEPPAATGRFANFLCGRWTGK